MTTEVIWSAFADELEKHAGAADIARLMYLKGMGAVSRGAGALQRGADRLGGAAAERGGGFFRPGNLDEMSRGIQAASVHAPIVTLPGTGLGTAIKATLNPYTRGGQRNWGRAGTNIGLKAALVALGAAGAIGAEHAVPGAGGLRDVADPLTDVATAF